jgi:hypothetical protein
MSGKGKLRAALAMLFVAVFLVGLYLMLLPEEEPLLVEPPEEPAQEMPYHLIGALLAIAGFAGTTIVAFLGAIPLKIARMKELQLAYEKGEITKEEYLEKIKELTEEF